jgi:transcriptional regulator with XRE-family HTH domain
MVNAIRQARDARGWTSARLNLEIRRAGTQSGVATASESSLRVMISQWENGHQAPSPAYRALLEKIFRMPAGSLGQETEAAPAVSLLPRMGPKLEITDSVLGYFERQLVDHVQLDNAAGPGLILDVVSTQVLHLRRIAEHGPSEVLALAARFLEHAGWLHQDSGNLDKALSYTDESVDLAERAGDVALTAYNTMRKSNVLTDRGEWQRAKVTAERAARLAAREAPEQEAICLRQVALAAAHLTDEATARGAVDRALELTTDAGAIVNAYSAYCTTGYLEMEGALCLLVLGQPAAAVEACTRALADWPPGRLRDEGLCLSRLALAHLDQHDVDQACAAALAAIERVHQAPSARAIQILRTVGRRITPFRQAASVRQLRQALATVA